MNSKPFSYQSNWGTCFSCATCDFSTPIKVSRVPLTVGIEIQWFSRDLAEMIGYHATNILPELNGFQGYDTIKFDFTK